MKNKSQKQISNKNKFADNPRKISKEQKKLLKEHLEELGDLSGVVYCRKNKAYVGGNQRSDVLDGSEIIIAEEYEKPTKAGTVAVGEIIYKSERYSYREVEFSKKQFDKACIVANSDGGVFDWNALSSGTWTTKPFDDWGLKFPQGFRRSAKKESKETETGEAERKELLKKYGVELGQLWQLGDHRL